MAAAASGCRSSPGARAQVSYDCWVERMEDDWRTAVDGPCHQQFVAALAQLEGPGAGCPAGRPARPPHPGRSANTASISSFDKSAILPEAQQILQQVATQAKQGNIKILLVGKADRSGSDPYNLALVASSRRCGAGGAVEEWRGPRQHRGTSVGSASANRRSRRPTAWREPRKTAWLRSRCSDDLRWQERRHLPSPAVPFFCLPARPMPRKNSSCQFIASGLRG